MTYKIASADAPLYLTTKEAAYVLNLSHRTLEKWRCQGGGPPFIKRVRNVLYLLDDLLLFMNELPVFRNTGEAISYLHKQRYKRALVQGPIRRELVERVLTADGPPGG